MKRSSDKSYEKFLNKWNKIYKITLKCIYLFYSLAKKMKKKNQTNEQTKNKAKPYKQNFVVLWHRAKKKPPPIENGEIFLKPI